MNKYQKYFHKRVKLIVKGEVRIYGEQKTSYRYCRILVRDFCKSIKGWEL